MKPIIARTGLAVLLVAVTISIGHATTLVKANLADLVRHSNDIVCGRVTGLTDGFDGKLPYTEVTILVTVSLAGDARVGEPFSFRQFGLLAPREIDGRTFLGVSPEGWPRFRVDEDVMLFLPAPTQLGICTTVGLFQGKFTIAQGKLANDINNLGLFDGVSVDESELSEAEQKLMQAQAGPFQETTFVSFVRRAIQNRWFE